MTQASTDECLPAFLAWFKRTYDYEPRRATSDQRLEGMFFDSLRPDVAWKAWCAAWELRAAKEPGGQE